MEEEAAHASFWEDSRSAQQKMQHLARLKEQVVLWRDLESRTASLLELTDLAIEEDDDSLEDQLKAEVEEISHTLEVEEFQLTLSGPYDDRGRHPVRPSRGGRHRVSGLGRDATQDVSALGPRPAVTGPRYWIFPMGKRPG